MGLVVGALLGLVALGGVVLASRRSSSSRSPGSSSSSSSEKGNIRQRTQIKVKAVDAFNANPLFAGSDTALEWAAIGAGAGGPFAPFTAALGYLLGTTFDAIGQPTYGRIVRDHVAAWLRDNGFPSSAAAVDAMLWRNALLGARHLFRNVETGELAVEVTSSSDPFVSLFGGNLEQELAGGPAGSQARQCVMGWAPGQLDGPNQKRDNRALRSRLEVGKLLPITYVKAPPSSWRTPGYVFFASVWPRVTRPDPHAFAKSRAWELVTPSSVNVDLLAAPFDRAAEVEMVQT